MMNCLKKKKPKSGSGQHDCCCCCKANCNNVTLLNKDVHKNGTTTTTTIRVTETNETQSHQASTEDGNFFSKKSGTVPITDSDSEKATSCYAWGKQSLESRPLEQEYDKEGFEFMDENGEQEIAYLPVSRDNPYYNMNHPRRGKAVIFNFDHWDNTTIPELGLSPRKGSAKDKGDLGETLARLDFEVDSYDSCGNQEMWEILNKLRNEDHTTADCLIICIMTHGERNTVFVRDGTQIPVNLIWEAFEANVCPTLAGKPKIFIIQACRGKSYDSGTILSDSRQLSLGQTADVTDSATFSYVIPNSADFLIAFSCPLGHYSWRNPQLGSWFIQSICKIFDKHAYNMDIQSLFTEVAREVALNYQSNTTHYASDKKKQVTSTSSTLIRKVVFKPKNKSSSIHISTTNDTFNSKIGDKQDYWEEDSSDATDTWTQSHL